MKTTIFRSVIFFSLALASMSGQQPPSAHVRGGARFFDPLWPLTNHPAAASASQRAGTPATPIPARGTEVASKTYTFLSVDYPGAASSRALSSNGKTDVGFFQFDPATSDGWSFTRSGGKYQIFSVPGAVRAVIERINDTGMMAGGYSDSSLIWHGFVDNAGVITTIDVPDSKATVAQGITEAGDVVGIYVDNGPGFQHGFVKSGDVFTTLDPPGSIETSAEDMNASGQVVGWYIDSSFGEHGFIWSNGTFTTLDYPGALGTAAESINDLGKIVGEYFDATAGHGFLYQNSFATVDVAGAKHTQLRNIDNKGRVAGLYVDALGEYHGVTGH